MGFVLNNKLLIIAGALDGRRVHSVDHHVQGDERSFANVLFGRLGRCRRGGQAGREEDGAVGVAGRGRGILEAATNVIIIPGYGMAVAQAQHKVRELYDQLTKRGINVRFAIHPVRGACRAYECALGGGGDPYDKLVEMDEINGSFRSATWRS